jgi:phosphoribosyl-ATP pyrophosphohydrolase
MSVAVSNDSETGLEVVDLYDDPGFAGRHVHVRNVARQMEGLQRLAQALAENPDTILQELVEAAVDLCMAQSAGISIQNIDESGEVTYHWVATAGEYARFLNAILPSFPSACGQCLERGRPQLFRVSQRFFDLMGIEAKTVEDGVLIPWQADETRGTIWIMSHERRDAFDANDSQTMELLSNFVAMAVRQQRQQKLLMKQAKVAAAAVMANDLAHKINNPLQSLTNLVYLAAESNDGSEAKAMAQEMSVHLDRLSALVGKLLALPTDDARA